MPEYVSSDPNLTYLLGNVFLIRLEFKIGPSLIFYQKIEIYWQTSEYGAFLCILEALQKRSKGQKQFIIELLL